MTDYPIGDIYPSVSYEDAAAAIEWLCRAFGFAKRFAVEGEGGRIEHSELSLGRAVIMVSSQKADAGRISPRRAGGCTQTLNLYVADPDAHYAIAMAAGAKIERGLQDEDYGARGYMVSDPEGHLWYFGTYRPGAYWQAEGSA